MSQLTAMKVTAFLFLGAAVIVSMVGIPSGGIVLGGIAVAYRFAADVIAAVREDR